jgi:maleylpyruvate isomerase
VDWSPELSHLLEYLTPRVPPSIGLALHATDIDRTWTYGSHAELTIPGELVDLTAWLAGRKPRQPLTSSTGTLSVPVTKRRAYP